MIIFVCKSVETEKMFMLYFLYIKIKIVVPSIMKNVLNNINYVVTTPYPITYSIFNKKKKYTY